MFNGLLSFFDRSYDNPVFSEMNSFDGIKGFDQYPNNETGNE